MSRLRNRQLSCAAMAVLVSASAWAGERERCLDWMERAARDMPPGDLEPCTDAIVAVTRKGDAVVWQRLKRIIARADGRVPERAAALRAAFRLADRAMAAELLVLANRWADDLDSSVHTSAMLAQDQAAHATSHLLATLIQEGIPLLHEASDGSEGVLDFLSRIAGNDNLWIGLEVRHTCYVQLATLPAPQAERQRRILALLRDKPRWQGFPAPLLAALDEASLPEVLAMLRESLVGSESIHWAAAATLAHHGCQDALPVLRQALEQRSSAGPKAVGMLPYYIWQIEVQNPRTALLAYIASPADVGSEKRNWAIERAAQAGLPKEQNRTAILKHAETIPTAEPMRLGLLGGLKRLGLHLEILHADDLPGVRVPAEPSK